MAQVVDLETARPRIAARRRIVQAANRVRVARYRYVSANVNLTVEPPSMLGMRHVGLAVAIVRHWGAVDDATLAAAGYQPACRPVSREAERVDLLDKDAA